MCIWLSRRSLRLSARIACVPTRHSWPFRTFKAHRTSLLAAALLALAVPSAAFAQPQVDLVLNVTDTPDPVPATGLVTYAVVIANNGLLNATGVTYTMSVPVNTTYQGFTIGGGASCSGMTIGQVGPGTVTCTFPSIAFNTSGTFDVLLRLNSQGTTTVSSTTASAQVDANAADNTVSNTTTVVAGANFSVTLSAPASLASGSTFNYSVSVSNAGPDAATSLRVQFPLPTGFTQSGALPGSCSLSAGTVTCDIAGPIAAGATLVVGNIPGKITAGSPSTVTGTATIALQPGAPLLTPRDPDTSNNTSISSISVTAGSDVRLTKSRSVGGPYFVGDTFSFILTAAYDGDSPSTLTITDAIPANYTVGTIASPQNGWTCSKVGQVVTCTRASGGVAGNNQSLGAITVPVTVASASAGVTNTATISSASPTDPTPSNNTATDGGTALLTPTADLAIAKSGPSPALVVIGVPFDWTLNVSNGGPSAFFGDLVITDNIPAGITINSYTLNGWSCSSAAPVVGPAAITCTRTVTSGAPLTSGTGTPSITMNATATSAGALTNSAVLTTVGYKRPGVCGECARRGASPLSRADRAMAGPARRLVSDVGHLLRVPARGHASTRAANPMDRRRRARFPGRVARITGPGCAHTNRSPCRCARGTGARGSAVAGQSLARCGDGLFDARAWRSRDLHARYGFSSLSAHRKRGSDDRRAVAAACEAARR